MNPPAVNVLMRDRPSLLVLGLVATVLSVLGWLALGGSTPAPKTPKTPTHMHCPACRDEIIYSPKRVGKKCTNCTEGAVYKATVGSIFDENRDDDDSRGGRFFLFALALVVAIQGLAFAGMWRLKILRERAADARNRMVLARCPFCKRKVAYPIAKAGTWTTCYQCKTAFALSAEGAEAAL